MCPFELWFSLGICQVLTFYKPQIAFLKMGNNIQWSPGYESFVNHEELNKCHHQSYYPKIINSSIPLRMNIAEAGAIQAYPSFIHRITKY